MGTGDLGTRRARVLGLRRRNRASRGRRLGQGLEDQEAGGRRDTLGRGTECRCHGSVTATLSQQALSVPRGTPATWRRAGSTRMPAQEDVLVRDSSTCLLDVAEGTLEGRASSDAITRSVAAEPVAIADVIPLWRGERARRRCASKRVIGCLVFDFFVVLLLLAIDKSKRKKVFSECPSASTRQPRESLCRCNRLPRHVCCMIVSEG